MKQRMKQARAEFFGKKKPKTTQVLGPSRKKIQKKSRKKAISLPVDSISTKSEPLSLEPLQKLFGGGGNLELKKFAVANFLAVLQNRFCLSKEELKGILRERCPSNFYELKSICNAEYINKILIN